MVAYRTAIDALYDIEVAFHNDNPRVEFPFKKVLPS